MSDQYLFGTGFQEPWIDDEWTQFMQPENWADEVGSYTTLLFATVLDPGMAQNPSTLAMIHAPNPAMEDEFTHHYADIIGAPALPLSPKFTPRIKYPRESCATCNESLDLSQQVANFINPSLHCTETVAPDHHPLICDHEGCGRTFSTFEELKTHSASRYHASFVCTSQGCNARLTSKSRSINIHFSEYHPENLVACAECSTCFTNHWSLDSHGILESHDAYECQLPGCDSKATQKGDLVRHQLSHQRLVQRHPCKYCRKYRGNQGFKRLDHLRQHIRNYHHIEASYRDNPLWCHRCWKTFPSLEEVAAHWISDHQSKPYTCTEPKCERVGMNGFDTKELLNTHVKVDHLPPFPCTYSGCDRAGMKGYAVRWGLAKHIKKVHESEDVEE